MKEKDLQLILKNKFIESKLYKNVICEYKTPVGYIDILLDNEVIEIKDVNDFKNGVGQLIAYNTYVKKEKKSLYLFGYNRELNVNDVINVCKSNGIDVYYLEVNITIKELL